MPGKPLGLTYSRISDPNDERTASLESQEEASVALLESRGFHVPLEYRFREQYTGMESIYDRPVLARVRELIASGAVQAFACYDTDRLAREPSELLTVVRDAHQRKVEPLFVRMDHETRCRVGEMLTFMKGWASALEWDAIRDRTMRGRMKIYQSGQWVGHGRVRYGYQWDKATRTRTPHPEHSLIVIRIFEQVAAGISTTDVADSLTRDGIPTPRVSSAMEKGMRECVVSTKWSSSTIRDLIREPTYKGVCRGRLTMPSNRRRKNGTRLMVPRPDDQKVALKDPRTTPLVSDELWEKANRALTARRNREPSRRVPNPKFMLYGLIFCGREGCGCRMTGVDQKNSWGGQSRMYRCSGNAGNRLHRNGCVRTLGAIWLEANVWQKVTDIIMTPGLLERKLAEIEMSKVGETIESDLKTAIERRKKISKQVKAMLEAQAETSSKLLLTALKEKLEVLDKEAESLDEHIDVLKQRLDAHENSASAISGLKAMIESLRAHNRLGTLTIPERRQVLIGLGVRVYAWPRDTRVELDIRYNTADIPGRRLPRCR